MKKVLIGCLFVLLAVGQLSAGTTKSQTQNVTVSTAGETININNYNQLLEVCIVNNGAVTVYFEFGKDGPSVSASGGGIGASQVLCFSQGNGLKKIGFKTASSTASVDVLVIGYDQ